MSSLINLVNMGIKSTYYISRETAIKVVLNKIEDCTNEELAEILEGFNESYFRNYIVCDKLPEHDDSYKIEYPYQF